MVEPQIIVRTARNEKADIEAAKTLLEETFSYHAGVAPDEPSLQFRATAQAEYLQECLWTVQSAGQGTAPNVRVFLAYQLQPARFTFKPAEKPVGLLMARIQRDDYYSVEFYGYIEQLIVTAAARHLGVGPQLLEAAYTWLRSRNIHTATLKVYGPNQDALRFYQREGFHTLRHELIKHF